MLRITKSFMILFCTLLLTCSLQASEILSLLPGDALSFALVRNVQAANDKIVRFVSVFREGIPAPLEMAQAMTGLSEGLQLEGDLLFALLPAADKTGVPAPMFLLPVSDYQVFAAAIKADATGEICRVTMAEEDVLVAKHDSYALVMNLEHRELMQQVLAKQDETSAAVAEQQAWLTANDVSLMVTPAGIAYAAEANKRRAETPQDTIAGQEAAAANEMLDIGEDLPFAEFFTDRVESAGLGLVIDEAINAKLRWQVQFQKPLDNAQLAEVEKTEEALAGYAAKPYVVAGGGPLPLGTSILLPELFTMLNQEIAQQNGYDDLSEKEWAEVKTSYELATAGLQGVSYLVTPGKEGEPLLSIIFARLTVEDSAKYLEALKKLFDLANTISEQTKSDIKLVYDVAPTKIARAQGIEVSCDLDKATGDGDQHIWQTLLTSFFGIDHKLSLYFCATDDQHVFFGMESSDKLAAFIEDFRKGEAGLASDSQVKKTLLLSDVEAAWVGLLNPEGLVDLAKTAMKSMMVLGMFPEVPDYSAAPPIALTMNGTDTAWDGEIVLPVEAARAMSEFSQEVEKMFAQ
ncbi:MAG: hypothetical protein SH868_19240 [Bythopirellula sp.]|nr:hypothetical protein [Bythopirellula sp.]